MPHFDARIARAREFRCETDKLLFDLKLERDRAKLLAADQEVLIKRLRDITATLREENEQMRQMIAWMTTGKEDAA
jgi:CHASE3 domain sensor protein